MKERINSLFRGNTNKILIQIFRYTFVGGFAFLVDFGLLFLLAEVFGIHYILSATLSFVVGLVVNYIISINWVFSSSKGSNRKIEFVCFGLIGIFGLGLNDFFMWIFTEEIGVYYLVSKIITSVLVYLWNFFARRYILFNSKNDDYDKKTIG